MGGFSKSRLSRLGGLLAGSVDNLTLILLTRHAFTSHLGPTLLGDFATTAYQALDD